MGCTPEWWNHCHFLMGTSSSANMLSFWHLWRRWGVIFQYPQGITTDRRRNILVVDRSFVLMVHSCMCAVSVGQGSIGSPLLYCRLQGIAFNASYQWQGVCGTLKHRRNLPSAEFGCYHCLPHKLSHGYRMQCQSDSETVQMSFPSLQMCRQRWGRSSTFQLDVFSKCREEEGGLGHPTCVAMDTSGVVYASEGYNNRVCLFSPSWRHLAVKERDPRSLWDRIEL